MTYGELLQYIRSASRDDFGYHSTNNDNCLHIYDSMQQVNICVGKPGSIIRPLPIANIIFNVKSDGTTRTASLIPVINGVSQYDCITNHTLNEQVDDYYGLILDNITHHPINTEESLNDILNEYESSNYDGAMFHSVTVPKLAKLAYAFDDKDWERLATYKDPWIRLYVVSTTHCLDILIKDTSFIVRAACAANHNLSDEQKNILANDESSFVRSIIKDRDQCNDDIGDNKVERTRE